MLNRFNTLIMDILGGVDMAELMPQLTRVPDAAMKCEHPPSLAPSATTQLEHRSSAAADAGPVYWCMSQIGLLFFFHWYMTRIGWQGEGKQAGALDRYKFMLEDEEDQPEVSVSKVLMRTLNRGDDSKYAQMWARFSHAAPYLFAGGWWWPFELNDVTASVESTPQAAPMKCVERASFHTALGLAPTSSPPSAAAASAASTTSSQEAIRRQNAEAFIALMKKRYPTLRIPLPPMKEGVSYTTDEITHNTQLLLSADSVFWEAMRADHTEFVVTKKQWLKQEQLDSGEYSAQQWQAPYVGDMVDPDNNRLYKRMSDLIRDGLLRFDPKQVSRVIMVHGPAGGGKTFSIHQSVMITHTVDRTRCNTSHLLIVTAGCTCLVVLFVCRLARNWGLRFYEISSAKWRDQYYGGSDKRIQQDMAAAMCNVPCILMFDECDGILAKAGGNDLDGKAATTFLTHIGRVAMEQIGVFIFLLTNKPGALEQNMVSRVRDSINFADMQLSDQENFNVIAGILLSHGEKVQYPADWALVSDIPVAMKERRSRDWRQVLYSYQEVYAELAADHEIKLKALKPPQPSLDTAPEKYAKEMKAALDASQAYDDEVVAWRNQKATGLIRDPKYNIPARVGVVLRRRLAALEETRHMSHLESPDEEEVEQQQQPQQQQLGGGMLSDEAEYLEDRSMALDEAVAKRMEQQQQLIAQQSQDAIMADILQQRSQAAASTTTAIVADTAMTQVERGETKMQTITRRTLTTALTHAERLEGSLMEKVQMFMQTEWYEGTDVLLLSPEQLQHQYPDKTERMTAYAEAQRCVLDHEQHINQQIIAAFHALLDSKVVIGPNEVAKDLNQLRSSLGYGFSFQLVDFAVNSPNWVAQLAYLRRLLVLIDDPRLRLRDTWRSPNTGYNAFSLLLSRPDAFFGSLRPHERAHRADNLMTAVKIFTARIGGQRLSMESGGMLAELELAFHNMGRMDVVEMLEDRGALWCMPAITSPSIWHDWNELQTEAITCGLVQNIEVVRTFASMNDAINELRLFLASHKGSEAQRRNVEVAKDASEQRLDIEEDTEEQLPLVESAQVVEQSHGISLVNVALADDATQPAPAVVAPVFDMIRLSTRPYTSSVVESLYPCILQAYELSMSGEPQTFAIAPFAADVPTSLQRVVWQACTDGRVDVVQAVVHLLANLPNTKLPLGQQQLQQGVSSCMHSACTSRVEIDFRLHL